MRTRCWVQVLEPGLCSPPSATPSRRPQLWNINVTFFLVFPYFSLFWIVFSVFFSIFHYFSLPQQRVHRFHVNHRRGVVLPRFWHSLTWNRSTISAPKQLTFFPDLDLLHFFGNAFKPVILGVALCWQQKCFKWAILNKEFNRKNIFHHLQIQDWAVGPQDPHRWLTWNMRTRCWVQVLEPGPSSRRTQLWNINLTFFLVFLYVSLFLIVFSVFFLFCTFSHCLSLFFSIFHVFHCPNNGFACSMLTTVGGGGRVVPILALVNLE